MQFSNCIVIIPAYNEENSIGRIVRETKKIVSNILVVDDSSSDNTALFAKNAGAIVIKNNASRSYDNALIAGYDYAVNNSYKFAVTIDADGQHDPNCLRYFLEPLILGNVNIVIGKRPKNARIAEKIFAFYANIRFGISDPFCGMKAFDLELYKSSKYVKRYSSIGTAVIFEAIKKNEKFLEIPIPISKRNGKPRFAGTIKANIKMLKALFNTIYFIS